MSGCYACKWEVNLKNNNNYNNNNNTNNNNNNNNKIQKDLAENEKGPLGCYTIWNSVLERLG